jgi:hypothetical protein
LGVFDGNAFSVDVSSLPEGYYFLSATMTHSAFNRESQSISFSLASPAVLTPTPTITPPSPEPASVSTALPESTFNWTWILVGLAVVPTIVGAVAILKKRSLPPKQIHGDLKIVLSCGDSTVTGYNNGMFSAQAYTKIDLTDVVESSHSSKGSMYFVSDQARAAAEKVTLRGTDEGIVFISSGKTVKISANDYYQNKLKWAFLDTSHSGSYGRIEVELNDNDSTNITITKR